MSVQDGNAVPFGQFRTFIKEKPKLPDLSNPEQDIKQVERPFSWPFYKHDPQGVGSTSKEAKHLTQLMAARVILHAMGTVKCLTRTTVRSVFRIS